MPGESGSSSDMNARLVGIEVGNSGVGEPWPDAVVDRYAATCAALIDWYGWPLDRVLLHATTGPPAGNHKIDPAGPWLLQPDLPGGGAGTWSLAMWQGYVADHAAGPIPPPTPTPDEEDVMFINKGTFATFAAAGGFCSWIPDAQTADRLGVPPADGSGLRGVHVSDAFLRNLILVGAFPDPAQGL